MDPLTPPLHQRLRPAHSVAIDGAVTVLMALVYVSGWGDLTRIDGPWWAGAAIVALCVLPAAARRGWPRTALVLVVAGQAVATTLGANPQPALAVAFVMYLIPLRFPRREALWWLAGTLLTLTAGLGAFDSRTGVSAPVRNATVALLISGLLIAVCWLSGYSVRQQRAYATNLHEQAQRQARAELAEARRAIGEQRLRIARELHDVVAHTMSLIAVQAGVANYVVTENPQEAARALASIEQTSRGALHEMRALLGLLRTDEDPGAGDADEWLPAPGLADLDALMERTANAGLRINLDIRGERRPLPAGLDLAAYRVVQEAVTNVIKHAATDRCTVTIEYRPDTLVMQITDGGVGRTHDATVGHGILGMTERVSMYGGHLEAVPLPGDGFQVTARIPLTEASA